MESDSKIIIANTAEFEAKIAALQKGGASNLHVVTDFDKTLTMGYVGGERCVSSYQIIRDVAELGANYLEKSYALKNHYMPIEHDQTVSFDDKYQAMQEWWTKHWALMIESGINIATINKAMTHPQLKMRDGVMAFFRKTWQEDIPVLIFSAGNGNVIKGKLKQIGVLTKNVHLIANMFYFGEDGIATGHSTPMITSMNKNETNVKDHSYYSEVKNRRNVILLGDSLGDLGMASGLDHDTVLSVGFLNVNVEERLESYTQKFDVVLLGDPGMEYVNELLTKILN